MDMTAIVTALITGGISLVGVILTVRSGSQKIQMELDKHNAVQDERISELTREVRRHNDFAERIPRIEQRVDSLEKRVDRMDRK